MSFTEQITDVQARIDKAQRERTKAEASKIAAQTNVEKIRGEMEYEFGVTTVDEAETRLREISAKLAASVVSVSEKLDRMGF